jgi:uncharacterized protein DUF3540
MGGKMRSVQKKVIPIKRISDSITKTGKVLSEAEGDYEVLMANGPVKAKKAFSCIIVPVPEDTVICCENDDGVFYILGIIEREKDHKVTVTFPSDTNIESTGGSIHVFSEQSISLTSPDLNCFSKKAVHKSKEAVVCYDNVTATGNEFLASFKTVGFVSNLINTVAKNVIEKFKNYNRSTENSDQIKAGLLSRKTRGSYLLDSKHTIMNSTECTKIDGEKILMG